VVFFNYTTMQVTAKIVYYGPGLCGKTTNLQHIHQKTAPKSRGEMISLETETDRTLFFDLLPLDVGVIGGMKVRLQLYTVPGQVFYNATRKLVLKGVDGVVFVADSQVAMLDANIESRKNLDVNLAELAMSLDQIPIVFQYNKRDIRNILPVERLNAVLNPDGCPSFEAAALHGIGVFETLKAISRVALTSVRKRVAGGEDPRKRVFPPSPPKPSPPPASPAPVEKVALPPASRVPPSDPLAELLGDTPVDEVPVEFAEQDAERDAVRPVETKGQVDIQQELEKLRTLTTSSPAKPPSGGPSREVERRLQDMLVSDLEARQDVKRKASIEVPAHLLKEASAMTIHLAFNGENREELVRDAVTVKLLGNKRLERLTLHIDLELKGKG
jgi:mutual gliding-motility protein MglA